MSYILEALKKAEAERRSGNAPSIHAPPAFAVPGKPKAAWQRPWFRVAASAAAALLVATAVWLAARPADTARPASAASAAPAIPAAPATPAAPPPAEAAAAPVAPPAPPAAPPKPAPRKTEAPAAAEKPVKKSEKKTEPAPRKPQAQGQAQEQASLPGLRGLPEHVQREIPPLEVGGYIYSGNKADRSVLINKRLLREGDEIAPGLVLEQLMPNGMVLNYRGHRYRSSY